METKARQLNNRRSKTKSYSPACLRTVQIESKTRRGNCEALRLEIPPPPALLPAWLPPSLASPLRPPPSALPPQCLFRACASGRWRRREGASGRPGGAEVRRRRSLAARAAVIISRKVNFIFTSPRRGSGSNKRQLVSLLLAPRDAHPRGARTRSRVGGRGGGPGATRRQHRFRPGARGGGRGRRVPEPPSSGLPEGGEEGGGGRQGSRGGACHPGGGQV